MSAMSGVLEGFTTIGALIALGALLAHLRVFDLSAQVVLSRLAFYVASPALMITVLQDADVSAVLSRNLVATGCAVVTVVLLYVVVARLVLRQDLADTVVGALCSAYVNAGNLGLPIAAYVLGDAALVAPTLALERIGGEAGHAGRALGRHGEGAHVGDAAALSGAGAALVLGGDGPDGRERLVPLGLVGAMAVPAMLIAYGVSLRLGPRPGSGGSAPVLALIVTLKLVVQPVVAYTVGRFALGMEGAPLLAVTVLAALPAAQNIFVIAVRYDRSTVLARDAVFATTVLSVPAVAVAAAVVG